MKIPRYGWHRGRVDDDATLEKVVGFHDNLFACCEEFALREHTVSATVASKFRQRVLTYLVCERVWVNINHTSQELDGKRRSVFLVVDSQDPPYHRRTVVGVEESIIIHMIRRAKVRD